MALHRRHGFLAAVLTGLFATLPSSPLHAATVYLDESTALTNMCKNPDYGGAIGILDAGATYGTAALFTTNARFGYEHGVSTLACGRYRLTVRARFPQLPAPSLRINVRNSNAPLYFYSYQQLDFSDIDSTNTYFERSCDVLVVGGGKNLTVIIPALKDVIFDWVQLANAPAGIWPAVEAVGVRTEKLLYGTAETGTATVWLVNASGVATNVHLRVRTTNGRGQSQTGFEGWAALTATGAPQTVTVPLPAQPEYGNEIRAEILEGTQSVSQVSDFFFSSDRPVQVCQYGVAGIPEAYTWEGADAAVAKFRNEYCPLAEVDFWAPCDMSLLVAPPGTNRWWSGQTLKRMSTEKVQEYVRRAKAQGIGMLAYVDYSVVFGWRILDLGREHPEVLDWDTPNDSLVWCYYSLAGAAALGSRQRLEDNATWSYTSADGVMRPIPSSHTALKRHVDQLVASLQAFDWAGYRYDDPIDYEAPQVDILGQNTPYRGWSNETAFAYIRQRLAEAKSTTIFGHNADTFDVGGVWYMTSQERSPATHLAFMRDGGFCLQEAEANFAYANQLPWTWFRDRNAASGLRSAQYGGETIVIIDTQRAKDENDKAYGTALIMAAGNHLAYNMGPTPYMQFACRYGELLYGDRTEYLTNATAYLAVTNASTNVWWQPYVRCRYTAPGARTYFVNLINAPTVPNMGTSCPTPAFATNLSLDWTIPAGWTPTQAWHVTADRSSVITRYTPAASTAAYSYATFETGPAALPLREFLALSNTTVVLPELRRWSIVAVDCTGPAADLPTGPTPDLPPVPTPPDVNQPVVATSSHDPSAPKTVLTIQDNWGVWPNDGHTTYLETVVDTNASGGVSTRVLSPPTNLENFSAPPALCAAGHFRFTLRARTESPTGHNLVLWISNGNGSGEPVHYDRSILFDLHGLTPDQGYQEYTGELDLGEAMSSIAMRLTNSWAGLVLDSLKIEKLSTVSDTQRLPQRGEAVWPSPPPSPYYSAPGLKVWYGNGLYSEYYHVENALSNLDANVDLSLGKHYVYGYDNRGWSGVPFPPSPSALMSNDLVVLANIPANTYVGSPGLIAWRDWIRGYVANGGHLLVLGGPLAFGRGEWHGSDILADLMPVTMTNYDLKPVGEVVPVALTPVSALASNVNWTTLPKTVWMHEVTPKANATVHVRAGNRPAIITGRYGKGAVGLVTVAPLGVLPSGDTAFWEWPQWQPLMEQLIQELLNTPVPPEIFQHPQDAVVLAPAPATFAVTVGGSEPLRYQWRRDGSDILFATNATCTLSPTHATDDGAELSVTVSNAAGCVTSQVAMLTVLSGVIRTAIHSGNWSDPGTWTNSQVPAQDEAAIIAAGVTVTQDVGGLRLSSLAVNGAVVFSGWDNAVTAATVSLTGTLTHKPQSATATNTLGQWVPDHRIWLVCSNLTINVGALIDVNGKGFGGSAEDDGYGPGGGKTQHPLSAGGGSYGGYGGRGHPSHANAVPGPTYGDPADPIQPGSGGGAGDSASYPGSVGGVGGGAVRIDATGRVKIDGTISANGLSGTPIWGTAGGSGGGIDVYSHTVAGSGRLQAEGGQKTAEGGGGGGGRIAIHYDKTAQAAVAVQPSFTFSVNAIPGHGIATPAINQYGTLYLTDSAFLPSVLGMPFDYGCHVYGVTSWALPSVSAENVLVYFEEPRFVLTVTNEVSASGALGGLQFNLAGGALQAGGLTVTNGGHIRLSVNDPAGVAGIWTNAIGQVMVTGRIEVAAASTLYVESHPTNGGSLRIRCRDIQVCSGGVVNADAGGFAGKDDDYGYGDGTGHGYSNSGGGAGYGGTGGQGNHGVNSWGGPTYGSTNMPLLPGSGGGGLGSKDYIGGRGGALVWVEAAGTIRVDGSITADGGPRVQGNGGAGSGGAAYLKANTVGGTGSIRCGGGINVGEGGAGGGGRVALWRAHGVTNTLTCTATGGVAAITGAASQGKDGTVFWGELPDLAVSPVSLQVVVSPGGATNTGLDVWDAGVGTNCLFWALGFSNDWLSALASNGVIANAATSHVSLSVNAAGIIDGIYTGVVSVVATSSATDGLWFAPLRQTVSVILTVTDRDPPVIASITSATPDGAYRAGQDIDVTVTFSKPVKLEGGNLLLHLNSGGDLIIAPFGSATAVSGLYTIQPGESTPDLDVTTIGLSGGSLGDLWGTDADLSLPPMMIATQRDIVIDGVAPGPPRDLRTLHAQDGVWTNSRTFTFDWTAPTGTLSGIAGYSYALDAPPSDLITAATPQATVSNVTEGTHLFRVKARNHVGVWGEAAGFSLRVDTSGPATLTDADSTWHTNAFVVHLLASDALSGVAGTFYGLDGGTSQPGTNVAITVDGADHRITYWSRDAAGNTEATNEIAGIKLDTQGPAFTGWGSLPTNLTADWTSPFRVSVTVTDTLSGTATVVPEIGYRITGESYSGFEAMTKSGTAWTFDIDRPWAPERGNTLYYVVRSADVAGNVTMSSEQAELIEIARCTLDIRSGHGVADPKEGVSTNDYGASLLCFITNSPVVSGGTQYVAAGWCMTGNDPTGGLGTNVALTLTNDAILTWLWTTNYALAFTVSGNGTVSPTGGWQAAGGSLVVTGVPSAYWRFRWWSGDTNGCTAASNTLTVPADSARSITGTFSAPTRGTYFLLQ